MENIFGVHYGIVWNSDMHEMAGARNEKILRGVEHRWLQGRDSNSREWRMQLGMWYLWGVRKGSFTLEWQCLWPKCHMGMVVFERTPNWPNKCRYLLQITATISMMNQLLQSMQRQSLINFIKIKLFRIHSAFEIHYVALILLVNTIYSIPSMKWMHNLRYSLYLYWDIMTRFHGSRYKCGFQWLKSHKSPMSWARK